MLEGEMCVESNSWYLIIMIYNEKSRNSFQQQGLSVIASIVLELIGFVKRVNLLQFNADNRNT